MVSENKKSMTNLNEGEFLVFIIFYQTYELFY